MNYVIKINSTLTYTEIHTTAVVQRGGGGGWGAPPPPGVTRGGGVDGLPPPPATVFEMLQYFKTILPSVESL